VTDEAALATRLDLITRSIALIGFGGLVVVAVLTFYDGAARYIGMPRISGFGDYGELVFPVVIASCFPAVLLRQGNVTVRVVGKVVGSRGVMWLEAFAALLTLAFFTVIAWQFILFTGGLEAAGRATRTIEMKLAPWWWVTTALMILCIPVQIYVTLSWFRAAITGKVSLKLKPESLTDID